MVGKLRKALAFGLALTMLVGAAPISARANNVLPVQSGAKNASAVEEAKEGELLYFVDAGDYNPTTVLAGEKLGLLNSVTDQLYGADEKAGYSWGLMSLDSEAEDLPQAPGAEGQAQTTYQWSNNSADITESANGEGYQGWEAGTQEAQIDVPNTSFRFAKDQNGKYGKPQVRYDFEVPAGTYTVEVGFSNSWNNATPVEVQVNDESLGTADIPYWGTGVIKGAVTVEDEVSKLAVSSLGPPAPGTIQVCYIKIYKGNTTVTAPTFDPAVVDNAEVGDLLYFVDAGDQTPSTVGAGEEFGLLNSKTDQVFGPDEKEGYSWGMEFLDETEEASLKAVGEQFETKYQYPKGSGEGSYANWESGEAEATEATVTSRFGWGQPAEFGDAHVRYGFDLPEGVYDVEVGLANFWGPSGDVEVFANGESLGTGRAETSKSAVVKGTAKVKAGENRLTVDSQGYDLHVCYIKIYKAEETIVDQAEVGDLLYFVDAGDYNTSTVAEGESLGLLNSKTDQFFGEDETTGYSWGLQSVDGGEKDTLSAVGPEGQVATNCQKAWSKSDITKGYEGWANGVEGIGHDVVSIRYADDYDTIGNPPGTPTIRYDFEVPKGYYDVEVGFTNTFGLNVNTKVLANEKNVGTTSVPATSTAVVKGTVQTSDDAGIQLKCTGEWATGLQVCYIKIYKSDESSAIPETGVTQLPDGRYKMSNGYFELYMDANGEIKELYLVNDEYKTNYFNSTVNYHGLGSLIFSVKKGQEEYQEYFTTTSGNGRTIEIQGDKLVITYENATGDKAISGFKVVETFSFVGEQLNWEVTVENTGSENMTVGDWGMPMPFNEFTSSDAVTLYEKSVVDHSFVGMDSSYLYAQRPNGEGRYLLLTPDAATGAKLEYCDHWGSERNEEPTNVGGLNVYYIHSDYIKKTHSGYLSNSSLEIPAGQSKTYAFNFTGVKDEEDMRSTLYEEDLVDMVAVPGFAYSVDMPGKIYLHTKASKDDITIDIQCPHETNLHNYGSPSNIYSTMEHTKTDENTYAKYLETKTVDGEQYHIYELKFTEFGQHNLIVNYKQDGEAKQAVSQFYLMDSVDNMLNDHAEFMVEETQLDRPGKVGHMLFDEWWMNIKGNRIETFGEDGDGYFQMNYWGWGDDWGATHAQFLAEMNAISPNKDQVEALDAYLDVAIWNELMREHQQDYIIHDFLMEAPNTSPSGRGYAYPHIYNTFFSMYKIASTYPELTDYREDAVTYLLRAYNIFCTQNTGPVGYGANCGTMGEGSVPDIIEALEKEGLYDEADKMLQIMEQSKYEAFENRPYPYGSEYPYDNTAEEGVFVAAMLAQKYGFESDPYMSPEERIEALDNKTRACRGMQPLWYFYANPVTICGESWWNFQYTCALAAVPMDNWLRLQDNGMTQEEKGVAERVNYAAKLGNLTSVNSGQINSDPDTIGTVAWIYQSEMGDYAEAGDTLYNGWRHRAGESGLGLWGALRILSADVATDPVFGLFGYGCEVNDNGSAYEVTPLDGVQQRLHLIDEEIYIELNRDQYTKAVVNKDGTGFTLTVDSNGTGEKHDLELEVYGLAAGSYQIQSGNYTRTFTAAEGETEKVVVPVTGNGSEITVTKTTAAGGLTVEIEEPAESVVSDTVKLYGKAVVGGAQIIDADKYEWTVQESGAAIEDADKAVAKLNVTEAGVYHVTLKATVGGETKEKTVTVTVKDDPAMKELVAQFTFEDDTIEGKDETGANIANNAAVNSVGDTMGHTALASNFQRMEEGEDGKAARFTGDIKGGYLEMTEDAFKRLESATISMDICLKAEQAINATLMDLGGQILLYFGEDGALHLQAGEAEAVSTNISMAPEFWKNVTLVADGDNYILYVDGKECASVRGTGVFLNQLGSSKRYLFGRNQVENGAFYNGLLDNLTIRSRALSADEVAGLVDVKEHVPLEAVPTTITTQVGVAPSLPAQIKVLYADGVYEMTNVTWEAVDPELYAQMSKFTVKGAVNETVTAEINVLVVDGDSIQLEQLPDTHADSIMGDRSTSDGPSILITHEEPTDSYQWGSGAWQNWGDGSQNTNAWVSYTWDSPKVITGSDAFFAIDGNQNFFPKSYYLEYLDENGQWRPLESTSGYKVVMSGYSNVTFNPVVTTGLRLTMTPSKDGSAILKWKVYGWNYGLALDVTSLKEIVSVGDALVAREESGLVTGGDFAALKEKLEAAKEFLDEMKTVEITMESQLEEYEAEARALEEAIAQTIAKFRAKDNNLAFLAGVTTSFVSGHESLEAVNDGIINPGDNPAKPRYGSWGHNSAFETITYTWANPVDLDSTLIQFWTDNGGVLPPASYEFYRRNEAGEYELMLTVDGPVEMNQLLESGLSGLALPPVKTVVEKNDARIQTGNGWSGTGSTAAGAYAEYTFTGNTFSWYGVLGPDHGIAKLTIDGKPVDVDCYREQRQENALLYQSEDLGAGEHTIRIEVASERNPSATDSWVELYSIVTEEYRTGTVDTVTDSLQVKMYKQYNDGNGVGVMEWQVFGKEVAVETVTLNKDEILFTEAGASETLIAEIAPHNATNINVSWSSDRPEVATVDENGKVTAVANGTATITVTTEDGNKTDSCVVTVEIPEPGHVHDDPLKKVEEKPATCTQEGNKAYYVCESCGTWFEDAAGEKPITDHDSVILPKTEHTPSDWKADADNHWKECTECTETIAGSLSAHSFEWIIDREATATEDGSKHEECSICGYAKDSVKIPAVGMDPSDPQNPEQPDPENPDQTDSENPNGTAQTGDSSLIVVWVILLTLAGFCIAGICIHKKRLG